MSIKENYHQYQAQIEHELQTDGTSSLQTELSQKALSAIYAGVQSEEWVDLMRMFANSQRQFEALVGKAHFEDNPKTRLARAHLLVNAFIGLLAAPNIDAHLDVLDEEVAE
jgi:hypothetical protein